MSPDDYPRDDDLGDLEQCAYDRTRVLKPDFPMYRAQCRSCAVAAIASGPDFHASGVDGSLSAGYRKALSALFGDQWRLGHELVKEQNARLKLARATLEAKT
jgi:hypothetical protein